MEYLMILPAYCSINVGEIKIQNGELKWETSLLIRLRSLVRVQNGPPYCTAGRTPSLLIAAFSARRGIEQVMQVLNITIDSFQVG